MSIAEFNRRHEVEVTAYNEGTPTRLEGGIVSRVKGTEVTLSVLIMHIPNERETRNETGMRFKEDGFQFQISDAELTNKNFEIITGRTHIIRNGYNYRVVNVKDYRQYKFTQAMQCLAVRSIPIDVN